MCGRNFGHLLIPALAGVLAAEELAAPPVAQPQTASGMPCLHCGSPVSPAFSWCPKCGQALRMQVKPRDCVYCGQVLAANAQYCPHCGGPASQK
mgnify:CR=1 FL=1